MVPRRNYSLGEGFSFGSIKVICFEDKEEDQSYFLLL